jgi:lon-related putative ATP-dependent protease
MHSGGGDMKKKYELEARSLEEHYDYLPDFEDTFEINGYDEIIGQERAETALRYGLEMKGPEYNIFVCGQNAMGKRSFVMKILSQYSGKGQKPLDWCYVYNFENEYSPMAISLPSGKAMKFKEDMELLIEVFTDELVNRLYADEYESEKSGIVDSYQDRLSEMIEHLYEEAENRSFSVKNTSEGFAFIPLTNEGKEMTEKEYNELSQEKKKDINERVASLKVQALEILKETRQSKEAMSNKIKELGDRISDEILSHRIKDIVKKYGKDNNALLKYMQLLQKDLKENIDVFLLNEDEEEYDEAFFKRYYVNIMTCSECNGMPVVYEDNPEYSSLMGVVKYESKGGNLVTDFTFIQPGSLHKANGGVLVIDAMQLLLSYQGWNALKRCLLNGRIAIDNLKNQLDIIPIRGIKPEDIPLDVKVVLLGSPEVYYMMYSYDQDFRELFTIKADFDDVIRNEASSAMKLIGFISSSCRSYNTLGITRSGVKELLKYSSRLAEDRKYFSASLKKVVEIIKQSDALARRSDSRVIDKVHIKECLSLEEKRNGLFKKRMLDMYKDGKYIARLSGSRIGEINALSVISLGDTMVGKQNRITAATFAGKSGVINIEREAALSGNIHNKGILILSGYLGETFGQKLQLSFNASICFEQLYNGIEGDSASAAELIAIMSSLGDIPIKQSISITGSVNQRGEIQPIGAVNTKIEGFFDICSMYGLDGSNGVIIPGLNQDELVLRDDILDAVDNKLFHIYAVNSIEECFEILWDKPEGEWDFDNVKKRIVSKLEGYNAMLNPIKKR